MGNLTRRERITLAIGFAFALAACAPLPIKVDPDLRRYIILYSNYKLKYTGLEYKNNVSMRLSDLQGYTVGACITRVNNKRINIDRYFWNNIASESERELLVLHELGHCDLDLEHTEGLNIMSSELLNSGTYILNKEALLKLLFKESK